MPGQRGKRTLLEEEQSKRQERANRILDAAADLTLRWGYNKTTIDDIARYAGVAKGTIYLHWKTREDLFAALMKREELLQSEEIRQRVADAPEGMSLHAMIRIAMEATMKNPLQKALLLRDPEVMGSWVQHEYNTSYARRRIEAFETFLKFLREQGLVRSDLSFREMVYMLTVITIGPLLVEPWLSEELRLSDEEMVNIVVDMTQRLLEVGSTPATATPQEVTTTMKDYITQAVDIIKEQQEEMES